LLKRGVELTTVAKLAGHASIQTTASFYINTSQKDKRGGGGTTVDWAVVDFSTISVAMDAIVKNCREKRAEKTPY